MIVFKDGSTLEDHMRWLTRMSAERYMEKLRLHGADPEDTYVPDLNNAHIDEFEDGLNALGR